MKQIQDIEKLTAEDLSRIGADESIPVPEGWTVRLPRKNTLRNWSVAAAAALLIGVGTWALSRPAPLKDTYDDPYLAYAAVEQALGRISGALNQTAAKVEEAEDLMDKMNYWK